MARAWACGLLIWLVGSVGPLKILLLLRVKPSDSRPPESRTRLGGPPSLSDRSASSWSLSSSMLLLTNGLRCFTIDPGASHCPTEDQVIDRCMTSLRLRMAKITSCSSRRTIFSFKTMTSADQSIQRCQGIPNNVVSNTTSDNAIDINDDRFMTSF